MVKAEAKVKKNKNFFPVPKGYLPVPLSLKLQQNIKFLPFTAHHLQLTNHQKLSQLIQLQPELPMAIRQHQQRYGHELHFHQKSLAKIRMLR